MNEGDLQPLISAMSMSNSKQIEIPNNPPTVQLFIELDFHYLIQVTRKLTLVVLRPEYSSETVAANVPALFVSGH